MAETASTSSSSSDSLRTKKLHTDLSRQSTRLISLLSHPTPFTSGDAFSVKSEKVLSQCERESSPTEESRFRRVSFTSYETLNSDQPPANNANTGRNKGVAKEKTRRDNQELKNRPVTSAFSKLCHKIFCRQKLVRAPHNYYFHPLPEPVLIPLRLSKPYRLTPRLRYDTTHEFILIQSLDGDGGKITKTYLAAHHPYQPNDFNQFVVLKGFEKEVGPVELDRTTTRSALRQELRVFKRLSTVAKSARKFIINSQGCLEAGDYHYLVLPLMRCDLLDILIRKSVKIDKLAYSKTWIAQMAMGLDCLHSLGIIHRNLKPSNVLVDWNGSLKIADFTRSYVNGEGIEGAPLRQGLKYAYRYRGTKVYMAPEVRNMVYSHQAIEKYGMTDPDETFSGLKGYGKEADVWSLGCIAAEILRLSDYYKPLFYHDSDYHLFITGRKGKQFRALHWFKIHGHTTLDFIHKLLHPIPAARMKISDIKDHPFYLDSPGSFEDLLKVRIPRAERPATFALKQDLSAGPVPGTLVSTLATLPTCDTPSLDSLRNFTWVNENGRGS